MKIIGLQLETMAVNLVNLWTYCEVWDPPLALIQIWCQLIFSSVTTWSWNLSQDPLVAGWEGVGWDPLEAGGEGHVGLGANGESLAAGGLGAVGESRAAGGLRANTESLAAGLGQASDRGTGAGVGWTSDWEPPPGVGWTADVATLAGIGKTTHQGAGTRLGWTSDRGAGTGLGQSSDQELVYSNAVTHRTEGKIEGKQKVASLKLNKAECNKTERQSSKTKQLNKVQRKRHKSSTNQKTLSPV